MCDKDKIMERAKVSIFSIHIKTSYINKLLSNLTSTEIAEIINIKERYHSNLISSREEFDLITKDSK